jgi:hypothetical protein
MGIHLRTGCGVATTRTNLKEGLGGTEEWPKTRSGVPDGSHSAVSRVPRPLFLVVFTAKGER